MSIAMIAGGLNSKGGKKWVAIGIIELILCGIFLFFKGHFTAVPFIHEVLRSPEEIPVIKDPD